MPDELDTILRLVAEGKLSPEEAEPIIAALTRGEADAESLPRTDRLRQRLDQAGRRVDAAFARADAALGAIEETGGRRLRIRVTERGRQVVNLRIPIGFVDAGLSFVPGIGGDQADRIRNAVRSGAVGPILDIDDGEDGVLISVE